ncbi:MAG: GNAT family N-acetyltransferase [Candidatus Micrarchaeota archaeon]
MQIKTVNSTKEIQRIVPVFIKIFGSTPFNEKWSIDQAYKRLLFLHSLGKKFCFYIVESNEILGFMFCRVMVWPEGYRIFVEDMGVLPEHQHKGLGKLLIEELEKQASIFGIKTIELEILDESTGASFWPKFGYKYSKRKVFSKTIIQ